jgi:hypothetical protein
MAERHDKSPQDSSGLDLTVVNSDTNQPVVYSGKTDALTCTLTNNTGGPSASWPAASLQCWKYSCPIFTNWATSKRAFPVREANFGERKQLFRRIFD